MFDCASSGAPYGIREHGVAFADEVNGSRTAVIASTRNPSWLAWPEAGCDAIEDLAQANDIIAQAYAPNRLEVTGKACDFGLEMHLTSLPGINFGYFRLGSDVRVTAPPPSCITICLASAGSIEIVSGRESQVISDTHGAVIDPGEVTYFENWRAGSELVSVRIDERELERKLAVLMGEAPNTGVRFDLALDLTSSQTLSLRRALRLLGEEAVFPGGLRLEPATAATISDLLITALVTSQPSNYSEILHGPVKPAPPAAVRMARELMDADPMAVDTVSTLAKAVHKSVRSLEEGFRKNVGVPPMAYLRQVRLARAHGELLSADPEQHTVARIARCWGFYHMGRFAQIYRAEYGLSPAQTLRQKHA